MARLGSASPRSARRTAWGRYAAYTLHYAVRVREIHAACEQALSEERQWTANWKQLVNRAAIEPIYED